MFQHQFTKFYSPADSGGNGLPAITPAAIAPVTTAEDIVDLLGADDKPEDKIIKEPDEIELKEASPEDEKLDLKKSDEKSEEEDEEELNAKSEDEEAEPEIDTPPRKKEVLAKFPELFKTFPWFEKMMFRDKAFTEIFGSLDDAKELKDRSETFNEFNEQLLSGKTDEILKGVREADPKSFDKIVDDYLPSLARVDKEAYFHVVGTIGNRLITDLVKEADRTKNESLREAALIVNQFLFGTSEYKASEPRFKEEKVSDEKAQIETERLNLLQERFDTSRNDLQLAVDNTLKNTISEYIDPRGQMTAYIKKNAVSDTLKDVQTLISNDKSLVSNLDKLWRAAMESKFDRDSIDKIKKFYLGAAKRLLPGSIKKIRAEALRDSQQITRSRKDSDKDDEVEATPRNRGHITPGRPSQPQNKSKMEKGESVQDFFARE